MLQKLLAALFAALLMFGGVACAVDADDDGEGTEVEVEDDDEGSTTDDGGTTDESEPVEVES